LRDGQASGLDACLISSCDILDWKSEWNSLLQFDARLDNETDAIVLASDQDRVDASGGKPGFFRPFPCVLRTNLLSAAVEVWSAGTFSMRAFFERIGPRIKHGLVPNDLLPATFNTPGEFASLIGISDVTGRDLP
jgi:hypothetical protein